VRCAATPTIEHRALAELVPQRDAVFRTPADWAGGMRDGLLQALCFGRTIVGSRERFGAERAFELIERHAVMAVAREVQPLLWGCCAGLRDVHSP
jgi:hypothetical protein